jgi:hypothetical protein
MPASFLPTTEEIALAFTHEITTLGGSISQQYDDGSRLFLRAVLDGRAEVRPRDELRPGVALRVTGAMIGVHPYVFRQVCTNGAILAQVKEGRQIPRVEFETATEFATAALAEIALTVRECAQPELFRKIADDMRTASQVPAAEHMLRALTILHGVPEEFHRAVILSVTQEFEHADDRTLFGVMNAITAVARDAVEPDEKWVLEELGGSVSTLAGSLPRLSPLIPSGARRVSAQPEPSSEVLECVGS